MILLDPLARPVIAHRGASGVCPENTLLAFRRALEDGADALELDVRASRDGVPVVIHDATLERTTDGRGAVADVTAADLAALDAGAGEPVPTFRDVLHAFPDTPLVVEIKTASASAAALRALREAGAVSRVVVGSFDRGALGPFRAAGVATAASRGETARCWVTSRVRGAPRRAAYRAFTIPERWKGLRVVGRPLVSAARRAGRPVHVWTVDRPDDATRLWDLGVSGIITNVPDRILPFRS